MRLRYPGTVYAIDIQTCCFKACFVLFRYNLLQFTARAIRTAYEETSLMTFRKSYVRLAAAALFALSLPAVAQQQQAPAKGSSTITFYERDGFGGRSFSTERRINNFERFGFNDRANSVRVRGGRWEVCTGARFEGRCAVLRRGDYPSMREAGLEDRISSARPLQRGDRGWDQRGAYDRQGDRR